MRSVSSVSDAPGLAVEGAAYHVQTVGDAEKLAVYKTGNYRAEPGLITYADGREPRMDMGYTLKFVGVREDLSEGIFDLRRM
ncbi:hypothetical protein MAP00_003531 [Monascus purpureus]|nr:hypothetical protein MAP00_003531 [Monascus purpureus]